MMTGKLRTALEETNLRSSVGDGFEVRTVVVPSVGGGEWLSVVFDSDDEVADERVSNRTVFFDIRDFHNAHVNDVANDPVFS